MLAELQSFKATLENKTKETGLNFAPIFAIFGILNYPIFYLFWKYGSQQSYESFGLRLTATLLCLALLLKNYWPNKLKPWFGIFWYFTILFCLPFFFFFMLLKNNEATVWLMSTNAIIFLPLIMLDLMSYIIIFSLGITAAISLYVITTLSYTAQTFHLQAGIFAEFTACFLIAILFLWAKHQIHIPYTQKNIFNSSSSLPIQIKLNSLRLFFERKTNTFNSNHIFIFGIFGLITYPLYYLIWLHASPTGYENFAMRIIASLLCLPLIFYQQWPLRFKPYLWLYWHLTIFYCLPFFFTVLLLKNNFSYTERLNILAALALLTFLVSRTSLLVLLSTGIALGYLYISVTSANYHFASII